MAKEKRAELVHELTVFTDVERHQNNQRVRIMFWSDKSVTWAKPRKKSL
jgi:hypothetical protein